MLDQKKIDDLKEIVSQINSDPSILQKPELSFFNEFIDNLVAGKANKTTYTNNVENDEKTEDESEEIEVEESDPDEDFERMTEETEPMPPLALEGEVELSDATIDEISKLKSEAAELLKDKKYEEALEKYTKILSYGNPSAMLYTKRASILLNLKRPKACIRDCTEALKLNADSANAYKIRGKAYRYLGQWENAHADIEQGQNIDYDEDLWEMQKLIGERYKKIYEKRRQRILKEEEKQKKKKEKEIKKRLAAKKAEQERMKREMDDSSSDDSSLDSNLTGDLPGGFPGGFPGGMPGGMPGGIPGGMPGGFPGGMPGGMPGGFPGGFPGGMPGGMPGGFPGGMPGGMPDLNSPEMQKLLNDPQFMQSMQKLMSNPDLINSYVKDPKYKEMFEGLKGGLGGKANPKKNQS